MTSNLTVGSICSGIEACSVAWLPLGFSIKWFSEIAPFPSKLLSIKYPEVPNLGDMNNIPDLINEKKIFCPDVICGGTPCQAFSLAGWKKGLDDDRGNLTLKFVEIVNANDKIREENGLGKSIVFWENVEGVLKDKTNAFGCFLASLAGESDQFTPKKWPNAGLIRGPLRNVAWRVLDAKYFGLPQQRRRLYVIATGKENNPENFLFEKFTEHTGDNNSSDLTFTKEGQSFEVFREYTDCLYSAYGTKWNGNAAAMNGSLFVVQNDRIRRLSPLECERLMGFPDQYTNIPGAKKTNRYQATGNSWAVPVISWIGKRILQSLMNRSTIFSTDYVKEMAIHERDSDILVLNDYVTIHNNITVNCSSKPNICQKSDLKNVIDTDPPEDIYISPVGCYGIIRRKNERGLKINPRLEVILRRISSQMSQEEIETRSRIQKRGRFSTPKTIPAQNSLFGDFF